jgi:hypothetical protein
MDKPIRADHARREHQREELDDAHPDGWRCGFLAHQQPPLRRVRSVVGAAALA